jgi:hypothetical protein
MIFSAVKNEHLLIKISMRNYIRQLFLEKCVGHNLCFSEPNKRVKRLVLQICLVQEICLRKITQAWCTDW